MKGSIVQDYFIILSRYNFISRSTSIQRYQVNFNISLLWRHGYTSIDRSRPIVMQPDAYWLKLNSCLYTGTKAGRSQSYQAWFLRNNSRDYLSQIFVSALVRRPPFLWILTPGRHDDKRHNSQSPSPGDDPAMAQNALSKRSIRPHSEMHTDFVVRRN